MTVKFMHTAEGEIAVLPRAEYEQLLARAGEADEDEGTVRLLDRARREVMAGAPLIPMEIADRIADGQNPVAALREFRGLTQAQLAAAANVDPAELEGVECGRRAASPMLYRAIATALNLPLDTIEGY